MTKLLVEHMRICVCLLALCSALGVQAQMSDQRAVPRLSVIAPALGIEIPAGPALTVLLQTTLGLRPEVVSTLNNIETQILVTPQLSIQPRYYFDLLSREADGKQVVDYAADFFSLDMNYGRVLSATGNFNRLVVMPAIGLQRNFGRRGYIALQAGPAFSFGSRLVVQGNLITIGGQLHMGWRLGAR